jgi:N-hydroxyarylamine O-acetyltransferase
MADHGGRSRRSFVSQSVLDLAGYLVRIGWDGPVAPDLPTLRGLVACHAASVPFENLDIVLGRSIELDLPTLQRKLVGDRRGGYCFEQNSLLKAALEAIGFQVGFMIGRVVVAVAADAGTPRTHVALLVTLPEGAFLADVGFGRLTPTVPLMFGSDAEQESPMETYRLVAMGRERLLQVRVGDTWAHCYRLHAEPVFQADLEMGNWFTSTRPGGLFTTHLVVSRPQNGRRVTLFNGRLTFRRADGSLEDRRDLRGADDYRVALRDMFGMVLAEDDLAVVAGAGDRLAAAGSLHPSF